MQIIQSKLLNKFKSINSGFTTKSGGISELPYHSLNLAFHVSDNPNSVQRNHQILASKLGYEKESLIHMKQIHSNLVHIVTNEDNFSNPKSCDALITDKKRIPIMVMVADCSPVLFYDSVNKVIAVAHAGRQGAFTNIIKNVIDSMSENFKSSVEDIYVTIGPSIAECCYEVGSEIFDEAKELNLDFALHKKGSSHYLNVSKILESQLLECGVNKKRVEISKECSCCKNSNYFSYRADGITGRFSGYIMLK